MSVQITEIQASEGAVRGLSERALAGEVFVARGLLQHLGKFEVLSEAAFDGIREVYGREKADKVRERGVEKIHEFVPAPELPTLTDAVYKAVNKESLSFLKKFAREMIGHEGHFYFERQPNVRFHIPYDLAAEHRKKFAQFAKSHGDGKITAHSPHRDSWVDCPDNLINVWIAVGPVKTGNSLLIYRDTYASKLRKTGPYIHPDDDPGPGTTFDLAPGDAVIFHGDQMHGSEINSSDCTRHVISFRVAFEKPHYADGHYMHYAHSALAGGPLDRFAEVPQNLAWSWFDYRARAVVKKLLELAGARRPKEKRTATRNGDANRTSLPLAELEVGQVKALSNKVCVVRTGDDEVRAFGRICPHEGADLAFGVLDGDKVRCPWHNLPIDPATGKSPCESLKSVKVYPCEVRDGEVHVGDKPAAVASNPS